MADKITNTDELWVELSDDSGTFTRTLQIENPDTTTYTTVAAVRTVLEPLFPIDTTSGQVIPFFYDDADPTVGLTKVKSVQRVTITKTVRRYEDS